MKSIVINQAVDVHWRLSNPIGTDGDTAGDKIQRTFANLIPACEFAVSMAKEGHVNIDLYPEGGPSLTVAQALEIITKWESGEISDVATHVEI
jgi:hypothetical protein